MDKARPNLSATGSARSLAHRRLRTVVQVVACILLLALLVPQFTRLRDYAWPWQNGMLQRDHATPAPSTNAEDSGVHTTSTSMPARQSVPTVKSSLGMRLGYEFVWAPVKVDISPTDEGSNDDDEGRMVLARRRVSQEESAERTLATADALMQEMDDGAIVATDSVAYAQTFGALSAHTAGHGGMLPISVLHKDVQSTSDSDKESSSQPVEMLPCTNENQFEEIPERSEYFRTLKRGQEVPRMSLLPDHTDKSTVLSMAIMSSNAYAPFGENGWIDTDGFNTSISFGQGSQGMAGHVFTSQDEKVVVIAIKGTSPWMPVGAEPSWEMDKFMDNWMFSCCCARVDVTWRTVCNCYSGYNSTLAKSQCSAQCLRDVIPLRDSYYNVARKIFNQVRQLYPTAQIWFTGHSLGGALSSLMGVTVGSPVFAFQSPGEKMYATRLGFQFASDNVGGGKESLDGDDGSSYSLGRLPTFHYGNIKDPIFLGRCTGPLSACYYGGYAMESKCHLANKCVYQTPDDWLDIQYHRIGQVITKIIVPTDSVPGCLAVHYPTSSYVPARHTGTLISEESPVQPCMDCLDWQFL